MLMNVLLSLTNMLRMAVSLRTFIRSNRTHYLLKT
nr:MAG TPA: hypothetical protein [Crassvirales sp.]